MSVVSLGELVSVQTGKLDANASSPDGAYPFFTCARKPLRIADWKYDLDAILVAGNGDLNVKHYKGKFDAYQRTYILSSKDENRVDTRYLYHFMDTYLETLRAQSIGGIIKYIKLGMLTDAPIPLPPLDQQKRIAAILDQADELRSKRQRAIGRLNQLGQAIFHDMFGDPATNPKQFQINSLVQVVSRVTDGEHQTPQRTDSGYKLLSARNVRDGFIDFENVDYVDHAEYIRISKRCAPKKGDVLISCSGTIGRTAVVATEEPFVLVRSAALVVPDETKISAHYLAEYLRTPYMFKEMNQTANSSGQPNLFQNQIKRLPIMLPPLRIQLTFAKLIQEIRSRPMMDQEASLSSINCLFQSLQYRAFQGEL